MSILDVYKDLAQENIKAKTGNSLPGGGGGKGIFVTRD